MASNTSVSVMNVNQALKELHQMIFHIQEERNRSADNLTNINKTHEKMKHETKVSAYFKSKLKSLYKTAIADAKMESELIQKAMEKITDIKNARNEKRSGGSNTGGSSYNKQNYSEEPRKGMFLCLCYNKMQLIYLFGMAVQMNLLQLYVGQFLLTQRIFVDQVITWQQE